jgi:hypothetical protein
MEKRMFLKLYALVIALFLLTTVGVAQDLPDSPGVTVGVFTSNQVAASSTKNRQSLSGGAVPAGKGPWIDFRIADVDYWNSTAALVGTTIANVELTSRCAEQRTCLAEIAPDATRGRLYLYTLPTDLALSYLSYRLKARGFHGWWLPEVMFTGANLFSAGRSYGRIR